MTLEVATEQVIQWMIDGNSGANIMEAIAVTLPGHTAKDLLTRAGQHFEAISTADGTLLEGWCLEATRDLYRRLIDIGDYPNALRAVKQMWDFIK